MNPKLRKRLIRRLRKDDAKLCAHQLKWDGQFCIFGEVSEFFRKDTGKGEWVHTYGEDYEFKLGSHKTDGQVFPSVKKWAEVSEKEIDELMEANDHFEGTPRARAKYMADFLEEYDPSNI